MFTSRSRESVLVDHVPVKKEPEFAATDGGGSDGGGASDDYVRNFGIDANDYCDYGPLMEDPESKVVDVYHHPPKEEPEPQLGDGDVVIVNGYYECDPPEEGPEAELPAKSDDADAEGGRDVGYNCSHCGVGLCSRKLKLKHELRCKARMQQKEFESQVTEVYHCGYCRCPFVNKDYKEQHQQKYCRKRPVAKRIDSNGPYFGCDKCEFVTKWKRNLEEHVLKHNKNNAEWFTCTQCSYKTVRQSCMTNHMKIHSNIFTYCCPICGKSFRTKQNLDDHLLRRHSDESDEVAKLITNKVYTCNICDQYRTTVKSNFNQHLTVKHPKDVRRQKYECPRCPYATFLKGSLTIHLKTHAEQKDYRCSVCKKQFTQKKQLDSHVLHHHADNVDLVKTITSKIHRCESCSFKTVQKAGLKIHVRSKHI